MFNDKVIFLRNIILNIFIFLGVSLNATWLQKTSTSNPLDGISTYTYLLGDFDTDNDIDIYIYDGTDDKFYANDGNGNFSIPADSNDNPFRNVTSTLLYSSNGNTVIKDLDGDNDLDILYARNWGFEYFINIDGKTYEQKTGTDNPFDGFRVSGDTFLYGDFDSANGPDLYVFDGVNDKFYANDGSGNYSEVTGANNPFDSVTSSFLYPSYGNTVVKDLDGDNDLDIFYARNGFFEYFINDGGSTYEQKTGTDNPFNNLPVGNNSFVFEDFDFDNDFDLYVYDGTNDKFYENNGSNVYTLKTGSDNPLDFVSSTFKYSDKEDTAVIDQNKNSVIDVFYVDPNTDLFIYHTFENSVPTVATTPMSILINEDTLSNIDLSSTVFADLDGHNLTVTLTASAGTFSAPVDGSSVGSGVIETLVSPTVVTLAGNPSDINTYLDIASNIKYTPVLNVNGTAAATITISASDSIDNLSSNPVVNINISAVNDSPIITLPSTPSFNEDSTNNGISNTIQVSDVDANNQTISLTVTNGTISISTAGVSLTTGDGTDDASIVFNGTLSNVNTVLDSLTFTPSSNFNGTATIRIQTDDGLMANDDESLLITVNNAPEIISINRLTPLSSDTNADSLIFRVTFSEAVTGVDSSDFSVNGTTATASVNAVSSTVYDVTVSGGNLDSLNTSVRLDITDDNTIKNTNSVSLGGEGTDNYTSGETYSLDNTVPSITISSSSSSLKAGETATITFTLSENSTNFISSDISVSGGDISSFTPLSATVYTAIFTPTVNSTNNGTIDVNANKFTDIAGNGNTAATQEVIAVDTSVPSVFNVLVPSSKTYILGDKLTFTVNIDEVITVDTSLGKPQIALDIGGTTKQAVYESGSSSTSLVFSYIVESSLEDKNGISIASSIDLNLSTLKDSSGNNLDLSLNNVASTSSVLVDSIAPSIASYSPEVNSITAKVSENLVLRLSEDILKSSGNLKIYDYTSDALIESIVITNDPRIINTEVDIQNVSDIGSTVTVSTMTITRSVKLELNKEYYILIDAGSFTDLNGNSFVGITSKDTWKFTTIANHEPIINSVGGTNISSSTTSFTVLVDENQTSVTQVVSSDEDGHTLTYSLSGTDSSYFDIEPSTGVLSFKNAPNFETKSSYSLNIIVSDNGIGTLSDILTLTVNINNINENPIITIDTTLTTAEDTPKDLVFTYNDEDGDTVSASQKSTATNGTLNIVGTKVTYTPKANYNGTDSFVLTFSDGKGSSEDRLILVTVSSVDDAPTLTTVLSDVIQEEDGAGLIIPLTTTDIDNDISVLGKTYSVNTSNNRVAKVFLFNDELIVIPLSNSHGSVTITISVTVNGLSDTKSFVYTLTNVNDNPFIEDISDITLQQSSSVITDTFTFSISDDESVTSISVQSDNTSFIANSEILVTKLSDIQAELTYSISENSVGTSKITVTVIDDSNSTYNESFNITVQASNDALCVSDTNNSLTFDNIKSTNIYQTSITNDLVLVSTLSEVCDATITWSSSDENVISNSGVVTQSSEEKTIIMTGTISKGSFKDTKDFLLTVPSNDISDQNALDKLLFELIKEENQRKNQIVRSLNLLTTIEGKNITWTSSDENTINPYTGYVTRYSTDTRVDLTATIGTVSKIFELTVLRVETLDEDKALADKNLLTLASILGDNKDANSIEFNLDKPLTNIGANGSTITWQSSNESFITNSGDVYRDELTDKTIILTATIVNGTSLQTKEFTFNVLQKVIDISGGVFQNAQNNNGNLSVNTTEDGEEESTLASFGSAILGLVEQIISQDSIRTIIELVDKVVNVYLNTDGSSQSSTQNSDGSTSSINSKANGSSTTVDNNGNVETQVETNNSTIILNLNSDGTVSHTVTNSSSGTTNINSDLPGTNAQVDEKGNVETSTNVQQNGFVYKIVVETDSQGNTTTKYVRVDLSTGDEGETRNTVLNSTPYPSGSSVSLTKINGEIYISTTVPLDGNLVIE